MRGIRSCEPELLMAVRREIAQHNLTDEEHDTI
jgi:hypothetical protein